jgi:hypothetical protein
VITKEIGFAYPTSTLALRFKFNATGCFVVKVGEGLVPGATGAAFATWNEAKTYADSLPWQYSPYSMTAEADMHAF